MLIKLILLFTITPFLELAILIEIGRQIGLMPTLGIVLATGILGASLARSQGLQVFSTIRDDLRRGQLPAESLFDALLILVGGLLLLTPGLITDFVGFLALTPLARRHFKSYLKKKIKSKLDSGEIQTSFWVQ